ncbi:hypothetical protein GCM10010151_07500 [Actinoallomurus spadix]|uniref:Uncharacterized protein n=1 Tax=Actinoallomurus spadix TaxID=79912 RepID=A0ABN0VY83_9ACTN
MPDLADEPSFDGHISTMGDVRWPIVCPWIPAGVRVPAAVARPRLHSYSREQILIGFAVLVTVLLVAAIAIWRNRG